jgi:hypothetical protein
MILAAPLGIDKPLKARPLRIRMCEIKRTLICKPVARLRLQAAKLQNNQFSI